MSKKASPSIKHKPLTAEKKKTPVRSAVEREKAQLPVSPSKEEREVFDFLWQHLRRNSNYKLRYAKSQSWTLNLNDLDTMNTLLREGMACGMRGLVKAKETIEETIFPPGPSIFPTWLDPAVRDSEEQLQCVLRREPDYFQSALWRRLRMRFITVAVVESPLDNWGDGRTTHPPPAIGRELSLAKRTLDYVESWLSDTKAIEHLRERKDVPVDKWLAKFRKGYECEKGKIRKILTEYPPMDFAIDTSLPWGTVCEQLQAQWEVIKDLRERVGLERDVSSSRIRQEWRAYLQIWDLAKELEQRDGHFPSWFKLAKAAYPEETATEKLHLSKEQQREILDSKPTEILKLFAAINDGSHLARTGLKDEARRVQRAYETADKRIKGAFPAVVT